MEETSSRELVRRYRAGSDTAARQIHDRYVRRLIALARTRLSPRLAARLDPDDIVQSAYRSFFIHARDGVFVFERAGDLWRLLAQITLNKLHHQVEHHSAQRRDANREQSQEAIAEWMATREPTNDEVVAAIDQLQSIMQRLNEPQRTILSLRLQGKSTTEIAAEINRSERTVRRILQEAEAFLSSELLENS